jgi:predicted regulator of Ras-like GTPase activity (Roadblock/LC7/MglB family)
MMADAQQREKINGFEGAVAGLPLTDVIQLKGHNRFSGCISVEYRDRQGMAFFRDGEIIHAEQGGQIGEQALYEIIRWPGGRFTIQPKVTTTSRTIRQPIAYLLLEAHRLMDEGRAGLAPSGDAAVATVQRRMSAIAERLLQIAGVAYAVLLRKEGTPVEDDSFEAEALAGKGVALAGIGNRLGALFGLGEVKSAAVHARSSQLLLFEAKNHYISIAVRGESTLSQVEAEIRNAFATRK